MLEAEAEQLARELNENPPPGKMYEARETGGQKAQGSLVTPWYVCMIDAPDSPPAESEKPASWHVRRFVTFDLETTSPDPEEARIVTAAIAHVSGDMPTKEYGWMADPGVEIPEGAAAIHGITTERARAEGKPAARVVAHILDHLEAHAKHRVLVIYNARYDLTVLDREARRHGLVPLQDRIALLVVDPLVIDKHVHRYRKGSRKLDAACDHYGAILGNAHEAMSDAVAAGRLAWRIANDAQVIRRARNQYEADELEELQIEWQAVRWDAEALHKAQEAWFVVQRDGLADYFRKEGKHEDAARCASEGWPLTPYVPPVEPVPVLPDPEPAATAEEPQERRLVDDLIAAGMEVAAAREAAHEQHECPTCWAPRGVRCRAMPAGYVVGPRGGGSGRELKHPHARRANLVAPAR